MDQTDLRILDALQRDSTLSVAELAELANLSSSPCWRRVQRLEEDGFVMGRVALLDPVRVNVGTTVFVAVKTAQHTPRWLMQFRDAILEIPEVVEVHRMSGQIDYLLKVLVPDIPSYDVIYKKLIARVDLFDVSSSFSMEVMKRTTALPLGYVI
ncbi:Lrp/AsnC family transcriptional regulator [Paraburkholderia sp. BCC1886]|uniref:Lrp/AsnC family transcriptional regulator n=1 Tax=Paraburkholderia sp. BCC1886 TaxID=2562670 RepID=UPI001C8FEBCD|nr:Lrp/AsnC family transcriptional regulator [Paraburkholderia sp. BCC1886]